jgi:WD40 repeat protein
MSQIHGHSGPVSQLVCCHPSKAQALSASYDKSVRMWDVSGSQAHESCCLMGHTAPVLEMVLQGERLATGAGVWVGGREEGGI